MWLRKFKKSFVNYVLKHWRGELPLAISFWVNFFLVTVGLRCIEWLCSSIFVFENPLYDARLYIIYSVFIIGIILPWQIVGLWRACILPKNWAGKSFWSRAVRVSVIVVTFIVPVAFIAHWPVYKGEFQIGFMKDPRSEYIFAWKKEGTLLYLNGELGYGVSKDFEKMVKGNPKVRGVIFNSHGGYSYEGRQLAKLIIAYGLNTYSFEHCDSACTIAFIAGKRRFVGADAKLGFHQSRLIYEDRSKIEEVKKDDEKDHLFFEHQGIKKNFLKKISAIPSNKVWFPSIDELLQAGVIHGIVDPCEILKANAQSADVNTATVTDDMNSQVASEANRM